MPPPPVQPLAVIGGGAAGFFAALHAAADLPPGSVLLLEQGSRVLAKVRISGGGRCNVTHACFDPADLVTRYPRGGASLRGPFHRFGPRETIGWFAQHGVRLKTEPDGRLFPETDDSRTVTDCLEGAAARAGVEVRTHCGVTGAQALPGGGFLLHLAGGGTLAARRLLLACGGTRLGAASALPAALGHTLHPPVPSLFTFRLQHPLLEGLSGISVEDADLSLPGTAVRQRGPVLVTHEGLSGPAVLRLSAWGARELHGRDYRFPLDIDWCPSVDDGGWTAAVDGLRRAHGAKQVSAFGPLGLPRRLWERLLAAAGIPATRRWAAWSREDTRALRPLLHRCQLPVAGQSLHKEEFVTCGGVALDEVDFRTMESRKVPGLYFAGEILDIDGVTGGFNFQAAWTTGWHAGRAAAQSLRESAGPATAP